MTYQRVLNVLTQCTAEADPAFRVELADYARRGLTVIGSVELGMTVVAGILKLFHIGFPHDGPTVWWPTLIFVSYGIIALVAARYAPSRAVRGIGIAIGAASLVAMIAADIWVTKGAVGDKLLANVLTVMLVGVAALPLTPLQSMLFNGFSVGAFIVGWRLAEASGFVAPAGNGAIMLTVLGGLCVYLSSVSYNRLRSAFELRETELRACTAESAITNVRLAAALSHELNTPLGALKSAVQTITSATGRLSEATPERRERLVRAIEDAGGVATHAVDRMSSVVQRIQRFSNLDGAEEQQIDIPAMLGDVITLHAGTGSGTRVETAFAPLPKFRGQPQALSAILSTLLRKALDAAGPNGRVAVRTRHSGPRLIIEIDHGHVDLPVDFQLGFAVERDRVSANWDLFSARQVIRALGGDIETAGNTAIRVLLPAGTPSREAAPRHAAAR